MGVLIALQIKMPIKHKLTGVNKFNIIFQIIFFGENNKRGRRVYILI